MMRWTSLLFLLLPLMVVAVKKDLPVSLVVDDAPVSQVLQTLAELKQKISWWLLTSAVRYLFI
jgi:protein transport protein HofQ